MAAVNSLPQLTEQKRVVDKHTNIASALLRAIKARGLDQLYQVPVHPRTPLSISRGRGCALMPYYTCTFPAHTQEHSIGTLPVRGLVIP